jgi:hypothetical protein
VPDTILTITEEGNAEVVDVGETLGVPTVFKFYQNFPNPFNPLTTIRFDLPEAQNVRLNIYSVDGKHIANLVNEPLPTGPHSVTWNGTDDNGHQVASGTYVYRLEAGQYVEGKRMTLIR